MAVRYDRDLAKYLQNNHIIWLYVMIVTWRNIYKIITLYGWTLWSWPGEIFTKYAHYMAERYDRDLAKYLQNTHIIWLNVMIVTWRNICKIRTLYGWTLWSWPGEIFAKYAHYMAERYDRDLAKYLQNTHIIWLNVMIVTWRNICKIRTLYGWTLWLWPGEIFTKHSHYMAVRYDRDLAKYLQNTCIILHVLFEIKVLLQYAI